MDRSISLLKSSVSRGKIEISVTINNIEGKDTAIAVNKSIAEGYVSALREVGAELGLTDDISLSNLIRIPDIFSYTRTTRLSNTPLSLSSKSSWRARGASK